MNTPTEYYNMYMQYKDIDMFYKRLYTYKGISDTKVTKIELLAYIPPKFPINVIDKDDKTITIMLTAVEMRILHDHFNIMTPTKYMKYFN